LKIAVFGWSSVAGREQYFRGLMHEYCGRT
jgi:hypothetical protein